MVEWIYEWEKPCVPFYSNAFSNIYCNCPPLFGLNTTTLSIGRKRSVTLFFEEASLKKTAEYLKQSILEKSGFIRDYSSGIEKLLAQLNNSGDRALQQLSPQLFEDYWANYWPASIPVVTIRCFNRIGMSDGEMWLSQKFRDPEAKSNAFHTLTSASKESFSQKEQKEFYGLVSLASRSFKQDFAHKTVEELEGCLAAKHEYSQLKQEVEAHLAGFNWFPCGYDNEKPWDARFIIAELKNAVSNEQQTLARQENAREYAGRLEEERERLLDELSPPESVFRILSALSEFSYFKDHIRETLNRFHYRTRPFLHEVSGEIGLKGLECTLIAPDDVVKLLQAKRRFEGVLLGDSDYAFLYDAQKDEQTLVVGESALRLHASAVGKHGTPSEVKGNGASPGKVVGRVKLVFRPMDYSGEKGIVLVAPMTNPDLMPAMRNAIAIVTDEGGITCHAAIVSRELGVPCIVGTKNASKVFHDGDLVEVDANNGVIRKLGGLDAVA